MRLGKGGSPSRNKKQDGGHGERADVCAQGGMAAHWSTFGALHRWRGRTGATGGRLQVRQGGEGREETNPCGGLERLVFLVFLDPPARSSRCSPWIWTAWPTYPPQGERKSRGLVGFSSLEFEILSSPSFGLRVDGIDFVVGRGLIDDDYGLLINLIIFLFLFFLNWNRDLQILYKYN